MLFSKTIEIDPVRHNLVNRIAPGTQVEGAIKTTGGLLVQGRITGKTLEVTGGPLVLQVGGVLLGKVVVVGDCYLFGIAGDPNLPNGGLDLEVHGTVHVAKTAKTYGAMACQQLASYAGGAINSSIRTIPSPQAPAAAA